VGAADEEAIREYIENQRWDDDGEKFSAASALPAVGIVLVVASLRRSLASEPRKSLTCTAVRSAAVRY
jgi:hypothetical protein